MRGLTTLERLGLASKEKIGKEGSEAHVACEQLVSFGRAVRSQKPGRLIYTPTVLGSLALRCCPLEEA